MSEDITKDMFRAAKILQETGKQPDGLFTTDEIYNGKKIVYMLWHNIDVVGLHEQADDFSYAYRRIRRIINEKLEETNGQFNRTAKASSGE